MNTQIADSKIIVALDYARAEDAIHLVNQLDPTICKLKIGKELFTTAGPQLVERLVASGFKVFLDLKFHDIPNTVARDCEAASNLGVWMLNVHASGGSAMMKAALEGVDKSLNQPYLIAVTVLTSMSQANLAELGIQNSVEDQVLKLATLSQQSGLHGVVCSAMEAQMLRKSLPNDFLLVTPGIRPSSASLDDQTRVMTPSKALSMGASYLVVGRPITQAEDPLTALETINKEVAFF